MSVWSLFEGWRLDLNGWGMIHLASSVLALATIPSVLLKRRGRPIASLSWILALLSLPVVGLFFWWAVGFDHLSRKRRKRRQATEEVLARLETLTSMANRQGKMGPEAEWSLLPIKSLPQEQSFGVFSPTSHNRVDLLVDGDENFQAIEKTVREAKDHVHFLFYIWRNDATGRRIRDLLIEKAKDGCEVRVLCDGLGTASAWGYHKFMQPLRAAGAHVATFRPLRLFGTAYPFNFRNHRKIVVVDGKIGFCGGINIGEEYEKDWHDLGARFEGPVIDQLQEIFIEDWYFATNEDLVNPKYFGAWTVRESESGAANAADASCAVIASGPDMKINATLEAFFMAINRANERIWVITPYFAPDPSILASLRSAVYRGVDVRLILPARSDVPLVRLAARSYYPILIEAGVRIFEFDGAVLHAKGIVFDKELSVLGSANFDVRSFRLNFEASCFIGSKRMNDRMSELFLADLKNSQEITAEDLKNQPLWLKITEAAVHLMSPLF